MNRCVVVLCLALGAGVLAGCISSSNRPPEVLAAGEIVYPSSAREQRVEGYVRVVYDVTVEGTVTNARVLESNPPGVFDAAALDAVRTWRFNAAVRNGELAPAQDLVSRLDFKLGESEGYAR